MYENLIRLIRLIHWEDFWEPDTTTRRYTKWGIIILILLLCISVFFLNLDDIQSYEYACKNPIIVEAEREIVVTEYWLTGGTCYEIYASYRHDGVLYEHIYYRTSRNPNLRWDGEDTITIAVNPNDPGMPIQNMYSPTPLYYLVLLGCLGLSILIYDIVLRFPKFREWSIRRANRPGFFSRPYGKPVKETVCPDYLFDLFLISLPVFISSASILMILFPHTF